MKLTHFTEWVTPTVFVLQLSVFVNLLILFILLMILMKDCSGLWIDRIGDSSDLSYG